jgi:DNA-binding beta-propeller fold protein YncE
MEILERFVISKVVRRLSGYGLLVLSVAGLVLGQQDSAPSQTKAPGKGSSPVGSLPVLNYKLVDWPAEVLSAAGFPAGPWNLIQAPAVATTARGTILVLHRGAHPLLEFESGGKFIRSWPEPTFSEGKVAAIPLANRDPARRSNYSAVYGPAGCDSCGAHSVRVDPQGNVWVIDAAAHLVYKLDQQGKVLLRLGQKGVAGMGPNTFNLPTDVAFAPNGDFYVSDGYGSARVVKFSREGKYQLAFGKRGTGPAEFGLPHNVVVDGQGRVYVTDRDHERVQVFAPNGEFLKQWKTFGGVSTLFITKDQHIWVGGVLCDLDGKALGRLPFPGGGAGGHGTTVTESGDVYVAQLSGVVQKFVKQ